jgi:hypothetical protein
MHTSRSSGIQIRKERTKQLEDIGLTLTLDENSVVICKKGADYEYWESEEGALLKKQIDEISFGVWKNIHLFTGRRETQVQTGKE